MIIKTDAPATLRDAFLEDHRHLTGGLSRALEALRRDDDAGAIREADLMDRTVGPHMAFEERVLYPLLAGLIGEQYVLRLLQEHGVGKQAVQRLLDQGPGVPLKPEERASLIESLDLMLDHAVGCGTLLSHLDGLHEERRKRLLDQLLALRRGEVRWTELSPQERPEPPG